MSDHKRCDKCGEEYEARARHLHVNLLRCGNAMIGLRVDVVYGGHSRDICDPCLDDLLENELAKHRVASAPQPESDRGSAPRETPEDK